MKVLSVNLHESNYQLSDDVETGLLVCDCLHHTHRDEKDNTNEDGDDVGPPGKMCRPVLTSSHAKSERDEEDDGEPPFWALSVLSHELQVNIGLFRAGVADTSPNIRPIEQRNVGDGADQTSKRHGIGQRKHRANNDWRVFFIGRLIQREVGSQNPGYVVFLAEMVKVCVGTRVMLVCKVFLTL